MSPIAGWTAAASLVARAVLQRKYGQAAEATMCVAAGGFIGGSALTEFGEGVSRAR